MAPFLADILAQALKKKTVWSVYLCSLFQEAPLPVYWPDLGLLMKLCTGGTPNRSWKACHTFIKMMSFIGSDSTILFHFDQYHIRFLCKNILVLGMYNANVKKMSTIIIQHFFSWLNFSNLQRHQRRKCDVDAKWNHQTHRLWMCQKIMYKSQYGPVTDPQIHERDSILDGPRSGQRNWAW